MFRGLVPKAIPSGSASCFARGYAPVAFSMRTYRTTFPLRCTAPAAPQQQVLKEASNTLPAEIPKVANPKRKAPPAQDGSTAASASRWNWASLFSSWQKGVVTAVGATMGVGALIFVLWSPVKADTVNQTADIASQALEDQRLKQTAVQLTKEIVEEILTDKRSVKLLADVLTELLKEDTSKEAVTSFIKTIFEDHYTQEISKKFVLKIVGDPWVLDQLHHIFYGLIVDLLKDPNTKDVLQGVLVGAAVESLKDKELLSQTGRAVRSVVFQTIWNSKGGDPPQPSPASAANS